jgi:hypothetical protein
MASDLSGGTAVSFIHYLFIGHFDKDANGVRFIRSAPTEPYRRVVVRPIEPDDIRVCVPESVEHPTGPTGIPDEWSVWLEDGYVICDKYTRSEAEIEFVVRLVEQTGAAIYDRSAYAEIPLTEWLATAPG